jgi:hypothetical protein
MVAVGGNLVGGGAPYTIATSSDNGTVWKGVGAPSILNSSSGNVKWNDKSQIWIATSGRTRVLDDNNLYDNDDFKGLDGFAFSLDGKKWHMNNNLNKLLPYFQVKSVEWNHDNSTWVASGSSIMGSITGSDTSDTTVADPESDFDFYVNPSYRICIATSYDYGKTWIGVTESGDIFTEINYVIWDNHNNIWIALGKGNYSIATSSDGIKWEGVVQDNLIFDVAYYVACNNDGSTWVAVGEGKYSIATSSDGKTWKGVDDVAYNNYLRSHVAWNGNIWVAVGLGLTTSIITSQDDGKTWSPGGSINEIIGIGAINAAWNDKSSIWVACGVGKYNIATSPDGVIWKGLEIIDDMEFVRYVAWNEDNSTWIAIGRGEINNIATSYDYGKTWIGVTKSGDIFTEINYVIWDNHNNIWIALGAGKYSIATSSDNGKTWNGVESSKTIFSRVYYMVWNTSISKWIAVGQGNYSIATSSDGIIWEGVVKDNLIFDVAYYVAYNEKSKVCVAVGRGKYSIATSSDGINWVGGVVDGLDGVINHVACNNDGSIWVAVGAWDAVGVWDAEGAWDAEGNIRVDDVGKCIATSTDNGKTWKFVAGFECFISASHVTWDENKSIWVALGYGNHSIATSLDGINWVGVPESNSIFRIGYSSSRVGGPASYSTFGYSF